jgi:TonB family protein
MDRLQKKCFIASCGMHVALFLVVLFGAAFFTQEKRNPPVETLRMVPGDLLDNVLAGGGGNPNIPRTEDRIKGETLNPVPPKPPQPVKTEVPKPKVEPKPDVAKAEPPPKTIPKQAPIELRPVSKTANSTKSKVDPKTKSQADVKATQKELAKAIGQVRENMTQGFNSGTAVHVGGPPGPAYASYRSFVFAAYDNVWQVSPDVANDDSVVVARVVIHRSGRIVSAQISQRSGLPALDKSVQRALDSVTSFPAFPQGTTDQERTFVIEFSLKAKRLLG